MNVPLVHKNLGPIITHSQGAVNGENIGAYQHFWSVITLFLVRSKKTERSTFAPFYRLLFAAQRSLEPRCEKERHYSLELVESEI